MENTVPPRNPQGKPLSENTFIYVLIDPETNEVRYVGKSNNPQHRLKIHIRECEKEATHKGRWIKKLKALGLKPLVDIIEEVSIDEWQRREHFWIEYHRSQGAPLTNEAPGGLGMKSQTPEMRAKISASRIGKKYPNISRAMKGKKLSPKSIEKRSATVRGRKRPPRSAEWREKLRISATGKSPLPETRAKHSKNHKGRVKSPEECKHISEAKSGVKRKPFTEEARRNMGNASRGRKYPPRSPETRRKQSEAASKRKNGPPSAATRAKISAGIKRFHAMKKSPSSDTPTLWD